MDLLQSKWNNTVSILLPIPNSRKSELYQALFYFILKIIHQIPTWQGLQRDQPWYPPQRIEFHWILRHHRAWCVSWTNPSCCLQGAFNCGVDPILTGSIPSALGEQGGMDIQASVAGFVNGKKDYLLMSRQYLSFFHFFSSGEIQGFKLILKCYFLFPCKFFLLFWCTCIFHVCMYIYIILYCCVYY